MQQTKSYWRLVAVAGVVSAFIGSACTVTTSTDDDDDDVGAAGTGSGTAGSGTAGSGTAGAAAGAAGSAGSAGAAAGSSGTAGTGGEAPVPFQCDALDGKIGTPNTCAPSDPDDVCQKCIQANCCAEYSKCYATDPGNQCGWGGPAMVDGQVNRGGEAYCVLDCIQKGVAEGASPDDANLNGTCANNCATTASNGATKECGSVPGTQTSFLLGCLQDNCSDECFLPPE